MKPTELMIGDWVKCYSPNCGGHRVDYINEADGEIGIDGEIFDLNRVKPIPLTPEILAKNDFMYSTKQEYIRLTTLVYNKLIGGDVVVKFQSGSAQVFVHAGIGLIGFNGTVSYVHELQHILRNFVEWEIDL